MSEYKIISADDHIVEPPDTWQARVPAKLRERAPKIIHTDDGDAWQIDGVRFRPLGVDSQAGKKFEDYRSSGETFQTIRRGGFDPVERIKDMEIDGVDAQVLFPNCGLRTFAIADLELQAACLRAYNDFVSEFCSHDPARLIGIGLVPTDDIEEAQREIRRIAKLPGMRGIMLPTFPRGEPLNSAAYDPVWALAEDLDLPVHIHLRTGAPAAVDTVRSEKIRAAECVTLNTATLANYEALTRIIFSGVLQRHPRLKFASVEGGIGWLAYFLEKSDRTYRRHRFWTKLDLPLLPSEYFHRQVLATFIEDRAGLVISKLIGPGNLMWSSDYPHTDTTWPHSHKYIEDTFAGVSEDDRHLMLRDNAARLYKLSII